MTIGRFITDSPRPGFENMAIDEMMVESLLSHLSVPTFRFYSWNPFCLSLGFHQSADDVNYHNLTKDGIDLVRRPTGGRAVFHSGEITYSVVLPNNISPRLAIRIFLNMESLCWCGPGAKRCHPQAAAAEPALPGRWRRPLGGVAKPLRGGLITEYSRACATGCPASCPSASPANGRCACASRAAGSRRR